MLPRQVIAQGGCSVLLVLSVLALPPASDAASIQAAPPGQAGDPSIRTDWLLPDGDPGRDGAVATDASSQHTPDPGSFLTVTGTAEVEAPPDRARVLFAVETEGETARAAGEANANLMTEVSDALRQAGQGMAGFRLETSGYSLTPRYGPIRSGQPQEIVGYTARNTVQVRVDEVNGAGPLIDAALEAGANRVAGLGFEVRDPEPYRHEAVRNAVTGARAEAAVMAQALGMQLGEAVDVQGGADMYFPRTQMASAARGMEMADAFATPIEAGAQTLTARVTIRFRLEPTP
jgi:uncharacterized protein